MKTHADQFGQPPGMYLRAGRGAGRWWWVCTKFFVVVQKSGGPESDFISDDEDIDQSAQTTSYRTCWRESEHTDHS